MYFNLKKQTNELTNIKKTTCKRYSIQCEKSALQELNPQGRIAFSLPTHILEENEDE